MLDTTLVTERSTEDLKRILAEQRKIDKFKTYGRMYTFTPYEKQWEFLDLGSVLRERMLRAGNQEGKTTTAAYETACHLTGEYPRRWKGRRYDKAPRGWVAGVSSILVRDGPQKLLCGAPGSEEDFGKGFIPKDRFEGKPSLGHGVANAYDTIRVRHKSGDISSITFKSYEQGVTKFQSESLDFIWLDEEPPEDVYTECLTRTTATNGIIYITFTPLKGWTPLVKKFVREKPPGCGEVLMTIYDAKHISDDQREAMIRAWPAHEREARARGTPSLGSNAVFEEVVADMLTVPIRVDGDRTWHKQIGLIETRAWAKLWGVDFGIDHPFAAVLLAWDKDYDVIYVLEALKIKGGVPKAHAERMRAIAADVKVAWPHDGTQRDKGSGEQLAAIYKKEGLLMLPEHATFKEGGYSTEAGIMEMLVRMRSERFKVAEGCLEWFDEFHSYYRKDGLIVKEDDDLMSATRIGVMQIRSAKPGNLGYRPTMDKLTKKMSAPTIARDTEFSWDW